MKSMQLIIFFLFLTSISYCQIIADHSVVDKFDQIPSYYINEVKKMYVAFYGESHSGAYDNGMELLEA
ncbi:MAG: hypothetical protein KA807_08040, partial [Prolixibacteraceae bacterium]|nr:hypothetical protein [Prolixibacteraceae bacterium]